ncbi:MAG: phage integrase N-terminal SAM-like domain-containing protein [Thermoanaerobacteraceae bacterium]|jgi:site-specific recombinase XerD|nr:phage integrase N-terminal SAM-like domain-containing protein [Thermoanaerobacteraceae bacterium]
MSYETLIQQLDRIHRHTRQGSILTRRRYYEAMRRFLRFVAFEFKLQNMANISNKHLAAYVAYLKEERRGPNYICTELAAIRFYHDQIEGRYRLTRDNEALGVDPRPKSRDRSWNEEEVAAIVEAALNAGKTWIADIIILAYELGLRIHEVIRLWRADAERALREGELKVKGKGGLVRSVPLTPVAAEALERAKERLELPRFCGHRGALISRYCNLFLHIPPPFELSRAEIPQRGMPPPAEVFGLDVFEDC